MISSFFRTILIFQHCKSAREIVSECDLIFYLVSIELDYMYIHILFSYYARFYITEHSGRAFTNVSR